MFDDPRILSLLTLLIVGVWFSTERKPRLHLAAPLSLTAGIAHPIALLALCHALSLTTRHVGQFFEACFFLAPFSLLALVLGIVAWRAIGRDRETYKGRSIALIGIVIGAAWSACALLMPVGFLLLASRRSGGGP